MLLVRDSSFYKRLLCLAIPLSLQNLLTFGVSFADNLMVGQLGEEAMAGLYLGTLVQLILQLILFGVENSMMVLNTQYWGKGDCKSIRQISAIGMHAGIFFAAAIALLTGFFPEMCLGWLTPDQGAITAGAPYLRVVAWAYVPFAVMMLLLSCLRSVEIVRIGLYDSIIALVVNVALNYIFIFGKFGCPAMGVKGAALGTVLARLVELSVVAWYAFCYDKRLGMKIRDFFCGWNHVFAHDLFKCGWPLMMGQVVWAINNFAQTAIIGQMNSIGIASASVADMANRLLWMGTTGVVAATGIITGKTIGEGKLDLMKQYAKTMQIIFLGIGIFSGSVIYFGQDLLLSFYSLKPDTIAMAKTILVVLAVIITGRCYQASCLLGLVRAGGDTSFVFKNDTFWVFCFVLPSAYIAQHYLHAPVWVVYACLSSDQITKCFVALWKVNSFNWMHNLTRDNAR
jgi:putative MATE family efflux protein